MCAKRWLLCALPLFAPTPVFAGRLSVEFAGGGDEITLNHGETVRVDIVWTMDTTDNKESKLHGINLRFNINDVPDSNGTDRDDYFVVVDAMTSMPNWSTGVTTGLGGFFSEFGFFLSAIHPDGAIGIQADGSEFQTIIGSFVLQRAGYEGGDTFITLRHHTSQDPLPDAMNNAVIWDLRWQEPVDGPMQFDIGLGNPGDAGPQWDLHGLEPFDPLIIHGPAQEPPLRGLDDDDPDAPGDASGGGGGGGSPQGGGGGSGSGGEPGDGEFPDDSPSAPAYEPPDRDGDGVPKERDLCPLTQRGRAVDANGCSIDDPMRPVYDDDGDGVPNKIDDCPGTIPNDDVDVFGCGHAQRDDDGDHVLNRADLCANTPPREKVNEWGCSLARVDSDGDAVADAYDLCPETIPGQAVGSDGCVPERPGELLQPAASGSGSGSVGCGAVGLIPLLSSGALLLARGRSRFRVP